MATVSLRNVSKSFEGGAAAAVVDVSLEVEDGAFVTLVGPSGCGKSTTLRMIAGLEAASAGEIRIGDRLANDVHPADRDVAMVFQSYALYPHMSVFDNIAYGLRRRRVDRREIGRRVEEVAELLHLEGLLQRKPAQLSGGQRQRVALGRAIVRRPSVFLMDEPLSNLDAQLRVGMRTELLKLHASLGITTIYVTHDQVEAMTMSERVVVMNRGRVEQQGPPLQVYARPDTLFVARFIGTPPMNVVEGRVDLAGSTPRFVGGQIAFPAVGLSHAAGRDMVAAIRPQQLFAIGPEQPGSRADVHIGDARVEIVEHYGPESFATISCGDKTLTASVAPGAPFGHGAPAQLWADPRQVLFFDRTSGLRIDADVSATEERRWISA
jgi:ABC-type sugar transport system ATPase subunit